jgi:hypothetical protein
MTDTALRYRVSPKILGAAQRLACQKQEGAAWRRYFLPLVLVLAGIIGDIRYPSKYWTFFIVACGVAFVLQTFLHARRLRRRISEEWAEISLLVREDGLQITQMHRQALYFWPCMREIREIPAKIQKSGQENAWVAIILDSAQGLVLPIPFSAFADDAARQAFVAAVKAGIEQAGGGQ